MATTTESDAAGAAPKGSGGFKSSAGPVFGTLEQVFDDVWWAWGTVRFGPGLLFPRSMTIVRERGELVVLHPIVMPEEEQAKIEALGPIKHIVRLGAFHGMDDLAYQKRYAPTTWLPPGVDVAEGLRIDRELKASGELPLAGATLVSFDSSRTPETAIVLARHGGILLACDSVQNWEATTGCSFLGRAMARFMGFRGGSSVTSVCRPSHRHWLRHVHPVAARAARRYRRRQGDSVSRGQS